MGLMLAGVAVLIGTGFIFWNCIPHNGKVPRLIESTEVARYIPLAVIAGVALGLALIAGGLKG